jgi:hypothetical protein
MSFLITKPLKPIMKSSQDVINLLKKLGINALLLISATRSPAMLVFSEETNNLYVGVCGESIVNFKNSEWVTNNAPIRYDDKLAIMGFCRTGAVNLLVPCDNRIFINVQMRDAAGKEVAKTAEGRLWGSELKYFPSKPGMNNHDRMASWEATGSHTNGFSAYSTGPSLPPPKDLFEIKSPGIYYLTMEIHLMKQHMQTNGWTWDHIVIPRVTVKVVKS